MPRWIPKTSKNSFFRAGLPQQGKNIIAASRAIVERFGGKVPRDFDELLTLDGVGRKTANVVSSICFGGDGIAVDTHVFRTANRLGLAHGKTPYEVEKQLLAVIPEGERNKAHHLLIFHGRYRCKSQNPNCTDCPLKKYCNLTEETE
ncbi:MAG: endonuclease III domain-containing protein [Christensenellales bacterium]